jgi:predicted lipoprotein with Yx(FWY)xxD motif
MPIKIVAVVAGFALVAAGAAAASRQGSSGVLAAKRSSSSGTLVTLHKTKLGKVIANSKGLTLYMYKPDGKNKSHCYTGCASIWPPLITKGKPRAGMGVKAKLLGVAMRTNGTHQVTYNGHPLYHYSGDTKAGQTKGEGYAGIWFALNAAGKKVTAHTGGGY